VLIRFGAQNHLSIHDRQELSMVATSLKDREDGLIEYKNKSKQKLLPAAIIYGANASGKSNLIAAFRSMWSMVLYSHSKGEPGGGVPINTFALNSKSTTEPTIFDCDFIIDGVRYHYGFEATEDAFTSEWLYSYPAGTQRKLFERSGPMPEDVSFGSYLTGKKKDIAALMRPNSLFLSTAMQNNHQELFKVGTFFTSLSFYDSISTKGREIESQFFEKDLDGRVFDFLEKIGTGVVGHRKTEREVPEEEKAFILGLGSLLRNTQGYTNIPELTFDELGKKTSIELAHINSDGEKIYFKLDRESAGTRRLLLMLGTIYRSLDQGVPLIIDELDASLHTQACEALVALFTNSTTNPNGAQLIATTHDTNLMISSHLRRDEIWFTEKKTDGATDLYPLSDITTKKGDNFEKGYLQGRYGAIPFASSIAELFKEG